MSRVLLQTTGLLILSNVFMTFAWYAHLRNLGGKAWYVAALASWGIALFEYLLQVPANRIGYTELSLGQLKILQEVITLSVFIPFAILYMKQPFKTDYLYAGACILGAVYFIFRGPGRDRGVAGGVGGAGVTNAGAQSGAEDIRSQKANPPDAECSELRWPGSTGGVWGRTQPDTHQHPMDSPVGEPTNDVQFLCAPLRPLRLCVETHRSRPPTPPATPPASPVQPSPPGNRAPH